jgi:alpha-beta hydrolase superfamily lysophospholipase
MAETFRRGCRCVALLFPLLLGPLAACAPTVMQAGPAVQDPTLTHDHLTMADGAVLPVRVWTPAGNPRAVVLALHGFNDYSNAFDRPARFLAARGVLTYAYDQRGFGDAPDHGYWPGTEAMVADLRTATRLVHARHPDLPLILLGESMGGAVVMAALARPDPPAADRIVLAAPAIWSRVVMPGWQRTMLEIAAHSIPAMQFTGSGLGKMPSDNIEMLRALSRDEKVIKWTRVDAVYGLANLMDEAYEAAPALRGDVLILFGDKEDILPREALTRFENLLPPGRCGLRLVTYRSGFHMLLRDLQSEAVLTDIAAWVGNPQVALPSGREQPLPAYSVAARTGGGKEGDGAMVPHGLNCASLDKSHARP